MGNDGIPLYPSTNSMQAQIKLSNQNSSNQTPMQQTQSTLPQPMLLGPENTMTTCQFCHASIKTAVKYTTTARTHIAAALCSFCCCMCCIPYASDSAKNSDHYCPNCERYLGTYVK